MKAVALCSLLMLRPSTSLTVSIVGARNVPRTHAVMSAQHLNRREALFTSVSAAAAFTTLHGSIGAAMAADKPKVVVFGGSGYVGAYTLELLLEKGANVVAVSRKSPTDQSEKVKAILGKSLSGVEYRQLDALSGDLSSLVSDASAVISCIGIAPGGNNMKDGNGLVNVRIADASKAAGVERFVYLGLASELANSPIKFVFGDYVKGKAEAEAAVAKDYGANALVLKPGIIAGGPPGEIRPPGPPGMAPVPVEAVARAAVAGAFGDKIGKVDGNAAIVAASK